MQKRVAAHYPDPIKWPSQIERFKEQQKKVPGGEALASNPLLLSIQIGVFFLLGKLPAKRIELYQTAVNLILHNGARNTSKKNSKIDRSKEHPAVAFLKHLAYELHMSPNGAGNLRNLSGLQVVPVVTRTQAFKKCWEKLRADGHGGLMCTERTELVDEGEAVELGEWVDSEEEEEIPTARDGYDPDQDFDKHRFTHLTRSTWRLRLASSDSKRQAVTM